MTAEKSIVLYSYRQYRLFSLLLTLLVLNFSSTYAQRNAENLLWIENSVPVNSTLDQAWNVLADFAGVGDIHVFYDETILLTGNPSSVELGAVRESLIPDGNFNMIQKERVVDLLEGSYFTYEIYDSEKSSSESMLITYGVRTDAEGNVLIYNQIAFKEGVSVWRNFSKRKQNRESQMSLISYKYHIETGESEKNVKRLKEWFALQGQRKPAPDLLATIDVNVK